MQTMQKSFASLVLLYIFDWLMRRRPSCRSPAAGADFTG